MLDSSFYITQFCKEETKIKKSDSLFCFRQGILLLSNSSRVVRHYPVLDVIFRYDQQIHACIHWIAHKGCPPCLQCACQLNAIDVLW